jgi:hypothetical protein
VIDAAGAVRRAEALQDNALAAELASLLEDNRAIGVIALIENNAIVLPAQQFRLRACDLMRVLAFESRRPN